MSTVEVRALSAEQFWKNWKMPKDAAEATLSIPLWKCRLLDAEIVKAIEAYAAERVAALAKELDIENTANFAMSAEIEQMRQRLAELEEE